MSHPNEKRWSKQLDLHAEVMGARLLVGDELLEEVKRLHELNQAALEVTTESTLDLIVEQKRNGTYVRAYGKR